MTRGTSGSAGVPAPGTIVTQPVVTRRSKPQWGLVAAIVALVLLTLGVGLVAFSTQTARVDAQTTRLDAAEAERSELHAQVSEFADALTVSQTNALSLYDQLIVTGQKPDGIDPRVIPGPAGPAGVDGAIGARGPAGEPGIAGKDGEDGKDGRDGQPGAAGSDGSDGVAGQAGADGAQGPAGPPGDPGPACPDGYTPTAAEIVVLDDTGEQTTRQAIVCLPTPAPPDEGAVP